MADDAITIEAAGREVRLSSPDKVLFPQAGWRKRDVVEYYLAVAGPAIVHLHDRPCVLKRYPNGVEEPFFFQKRTPKTYDWLETAIVTFPSGRHAEELVIQDAAHLMLTYESEPLSFLQVPGAKDIVVEVAGAKVDVPTPRETVTLDSARCTAAPAARCSSRRC